MKSLRLSSVRFALLLATLWPSGCDGEPGADAGVDPGLDVPGLDAPELPGLDAPGSDVPGLDAPRPDTGPTGEIVPADRRIDWDPGVRGGIPDRTACATLAAGSTAAQIQAALDACGEGAVVLEEGTYTLNRALTLPSNVTLRGAGIGRTRLVGAAGFGDDAILVFDDGFDDSWGAPARSLVAPAQGATTLTTTAAHGWSEGDVILVDMLEQPDGDPPIDNNGSLGDCLWCGRARGTRPIGQWVRVQSVPSATTAVVDPPLYWDYANAPEAVEMTGLTTRAGVEDLTVDNLASRAMDTVAVFGAIECWLRRVELIGSNRRALWGYGALWFTMEGSRVTGGVPIGRDLDPQYTSDRSYGIFLGPHFTASLFTDNVIDRLTNAIAWEGNASGNVFSYNMIADMWWQDTDGDFPRRFGPLMHGPHPFMNLLEGNWSSDRFRADEYWGTSSHFVLLRNRLRQQDRGAPYAQSWVVDVERRNWYYSLVGNLLGEAGVEDEYALNGEGHPYDDGPVSIYRLGYCALCGDADLFDPDVERTMIRHGNWVSRLSDDAPGAGIEWDPSIAEHTLPESFYLDGPPAFFTGYAWPPFDPTRPEEHQPTRIPAGRRYCDAVPAASVCAL